MTLEPGAAKMAEMREKIEATELPESLGAFVRERAETMGDATLGNWFDAGESMTYAELDERADRLAASLLALGVRKNTHVAVMLPNVPAFPISWPSPPPPRRSPRWFAWRARSYTRVPPSHRGVHVPSP